MKRLFLTLIIVLSFGILLTQAQDNGLTSDDPPYYCPNKDGAFYQANVFPRYDINTHSLVLIDATTNQPVRTLDTFDDNVRIFNWSPDCRYLTGSVGKISAGGKRADPALGDYVSWNYHSTVIWDALNGGRMNSVQDAGLYSDFIHTSPVIWSPDVHYALLLSGCPTSHAYVGCLYLRETYDFIWNTGNNTLYRVGGLPLGEGISESSGRIYLRYIHNKTDFKQYYWDMTRGWLWGSNSGGISAYDVSTGIEVRLFSNSSWTQSRFFFSGDNTKVVAYSVAETGSAGNAAITVYDIDSQASVAVNVEGLAAPEIPLANYHPVALSADNRYLAVGYDAIRVWDLQNLPEKFEDRLPIYRHAGPKALIQSLHFSSDGVIETNSKEGIQHWDLHTGAFIAN